MNVIVAPDAATLLSGPYIQYLLTLTPQQRAHAFKPYSDCFEFVQPGLVSLRHTALGLLVILEPTLRSEIIAAFYKNSRFDWNPFLPNQGRAWRFFQRHTLPMIHHLVISVRIYDAWWDPGSDLRQVVDKMAEKTELHRNGQLDNWSLLSLRIRGLIRRGQTINNRFHLGHHSVRRLLQSGVAVAFEFAYQPQ